MKLVIAWLSLLMVAAGLAAATSSCSINHRSDAYACTVDSDCSDRPRICSEGFCVLTPVDAGRDAVRDGSPQPDARPGDGGNPQPDAPPNACPDICTSCEPGDNNELVTCRIDCSVAGQTCFAPIVCPPGLACEVDCNVNGSCRATVDCRAAARCTFSCTGDNSCRGLQCGEGPCLVDCAGDADCRGVQCAQSCACDVNCAGDSCADVTCPGVACGAFDGGCNSARPGCDTCP